MPTRLALGMLIVLVAVFSIGAGTALAAPPANDNFASPSNLDGNPNPGDIVQLSSNVDATTEGGGGELAPIIGGSSVDTYRHSIWHSWTAPTSGTVLIDTCASTTIDTILSLYTGNALSSLTKVTNDADDGCSGTSLPAKMTATVVAGTVYRIRVAGFQLGEVGTINLKLKTRPYNASAPTLTGTPTVGQDLTTNGGIWFGAMPQTKAYTWLSCVDTTLGSCTPIATFAEGVRTLQPEDVGAYIRISATTTNELGSAATASVSPPVGPVAPPPPSNDNFANATDLGGGVDAFQLATNAGASFQGGEPMPFAGASASINSVWFKWTAPSSGPSVFSTCLSGLQFDSVLAVYTSAGAGFGTLNKIAEDDDGCGAPASRFSTTRAKVTAGTTYWIQVATYSTTTTFGVPGPFTLTIALAAPNDDLADATDLGSGASVTANATNYNATEEVNEPNPVEPENIHSIWFKWTAPVSGSAVFDTCSSPMGTEKPGHDGVMAIYTASGSGFANLTKLEPGDDDGCDGIGSMPKLTKTVAAGTTYWIQVGKRNTSFGFGPPGPITLKIGTRPINLSAPQLGGTPAVGQTLTFISGGWNGLAPLSLSRQWERCGDAAGSSCTDIPAATGASYALTAADQGSFIRVSELATNSLGAADAEVRSSTVGPIVAAPVDAPSIIPPSVAPPVDPLSIILPIANANKLKAKAKKGSLTIPKTTVSCASSATGACTGTAKLTIKLKKRTIKLGTIKLSFAKGTKQSIKLKLSKSAAKKLKGVKNAAASAVLSISAPGFAKKTATVKFTLSG